MELTVLVLLVLINLMEKVNEKQTLAVQTYPEKITQVLAYLESRDRVHQDDGVIKV